MAGRHRHAADGVEGCLKTTVGRRQRRQQRYRTSRAMEALASDLPGIPGDRDSRRRPSSPVQLHRPGVKPPAIRPASLPTRTKCVSSLVGGLKCKATLRHHLQRTVLGPAVHRRLPEPRSVHRSRGRLNHSFCNFILSRAFDDCVSAAACTDSPGVVDVDSQTYKGRHGDHR